MNSIPKTQNQTKQLDKLAAQRWLYTIAKRVLAAEMVVTIPLPIILGIVVIADPSWKAIAAVASVTIALVVNFVFIPQQRRVRMLAAQVQESFDCDVMQMPENSILCGTSVDPEIIHSSASRLKRKNGSNDPYAGLKDWYPVTVGKLPLHLARIVCQRANCRWDAQLRRRYSTLVAITTVIGILLAILFAVQQGLGVDSLFLTILLLLPLLIFGPRQYQEHMRAANSLDKLKGHADALWNKGINAHIPIPELESDSRRLQDEIFRNRSSNPLIFNWLYNYLKRDQEEEMQLGASELVQRALSNTHKP